MESSRAPTRVFISYSHDSPEHKLRVRALSDQFISDGVDCHLDQYETSPPEGWPRWMHDQIQNAAFVLMVCTETYQARVAGRTKGGSGLGAAWEGAIITQALYDAGGRNERFIPIVFGPKDVCFIPAFVAAVTRYDVGDSRGYEDLYRHLTGQPKVRKPPLGKVKTLAPDGSAPSALLVDTRGPQGSTEESHFALLATPSGDMQLIACEEVKEGRDTLTLGLLPGSPAESTFLSALARGGHREVHAVFDLTAVSARVDDAVRLVQDGRETWTVQLLKTEALRSGMEMGTSEYSADDIAQLKARRILLNEGLPSQTGHRGQDALLEVLVRGIDIPLEIVESPFPELFARLGTDRTVFLAAARLLGVLWLRMSGVVEDVLSLDVNLTRDGKLAVAFEGRRARAYSNVDPPLVKVVGECPLTGPVPNQSLRPDDDRRR